MRLMLALLVFNFDINLDFAAPVVTCFICDVVTALISNVTGSYTHMSRQLKVLN